MSDGLLVKQVASIQKQLDEGEQRKIRLFRSIALVFFMLFLISYVMRPVFGGHSGVFSSAFSIKAAATQTKWKEDLKSRVSDRYTWLKALPIMSLFADPYLAYSRNVVKVFYYIPPAPAARSTDNTDFEEISLGFQQFSAALSRMAIEALLCLGFVITCFFPLWILAGILSFHVARKIFIPKRTKDMLGICHRGNSPFYSGIHAPLRLNKKISATDYSCPSLACPKMADEKQAKEHQLTKILEHYKADNNTNKDLIRVILAYSDFPGIVEEENYNKDENTEKELTADQESNDFGIITNEEGTILSSSLIGLPALLKIHRLLQSFWQQESPVKAETNFAQYLKASRVPHETLDQLSKLLLASLTPRRSAAIAQLPASLIASAYLATEAGKSLVYKRDQHGFVQISLFPQLQARAIIQSIVSFHEEYDGDARFILRLAILCARRHGDFGRPFLPYRMPLQSRALRDWLEILYAGPRIQDDAAKLVELDAHVDELAEKWRNDFSVHAKNIMSYEIEQIESINASKKNPIPIADKGIPYKSVVLLPLHQLLKIVFTDLSLERREHMARLLTETREYQAGISVSSRLPGFKRQAQEAQNKGDAGSVTDLIRKSANGEQIATDWLIVRRMLTRTNWLSTRIGDYSVPVDGLVQAIVAQEPQNLGEESPPGIGLDALVPIRKRRFREVLGSRWEHVYYPEDASSYKLRVFMDTKEFAEQLAEEMRSSPAKMKFDQPRAEAQNAKKGSIVFA